MTNRLRRLLAALDRFDRPIPLRTLQKHVRAAALTPSDVRPFVHFGESCYRRNLAHDGPHYQALVLCWRSGQRSPIHDHTGSACVVHVLAGIGTETFFALSPSGLIYPVRSRRVRPGATIGSYDGDMHQLGNLGPAGADLITLHIYSPPLIGMRTYFLGDAVLGECRNAVRAAVRVRAAALAALPARGARKGAS